MADTRTDEQKARDITNTLNKLEQVRQPYEGMVDNIIRFVNHGRRFVSDKYNQKGNQTGIDVYDGTALSALNLLADGLHGYLVSQAIRWFSLMMPKVMKTSRASSNMRRWDGQRVDDVPEVKEWLEECEECLYSAFLRSNFYDVMPDVFRDAGSVGTVTTNIEEDFEKGRLVFTVPHFREMYIGENQYGYVDTNYRVYFLTLRQLSQKFGDEVMGKVVEQWDDKRKKSPYDELEIVHAVYPRNEFDGKRVDKKGKPWASMWMLRDKSKLLEESGYDENPSVTWRWRKNNDEIYGRSPAWDAYVDIMTANQQGRSNLIAGQKMVEPPMWGPADLRGKVNSSPGGWTWAENVERGKPQPLFEGIKLPYAEEQQTRTDEKIRDHFAVDFFLMLSRAAFEKLDITATQVVEMRGEKAAILGTRIGRCQSEQLNPTIDRVFSIEYRAGRLPPPPDVLYEYAGANIEVDYLGPLAQAQKSLFRSQGITTGIESITAMAQIFPEILDNIDPDETAYELLEARGFPAKCMRTEDEVKELREQRKKLVAEKAAIENVPKFLKTIPNAGKAPEPGSPLGEMMGMTEQPGAVA